MARAASLPDGGAYEYGAAIAIGSPCGPCTPATEGAPCEPQPTPQAPPPPPPPLMNAPSPPVLTQPLRAASSIIVPAVRFIASPFGYRRPGFPLSASKSP